MQIPHTHANNTNYYLTSIFPALWLADSDISILATTLYSNWMLHRGESLVINNTKNNKIIYQLSENDIYIGIRPREI